MSREKSVLVQFPSRAADTWIEPSAMDRVKGMANAARQKLQKSDPTEGTPEEPEQLRLDHQKLRDVRNVLQEVINASQKANKSSTAAIEDGRALGESFGQHGRSSEPGSGLSICALRAAEFTKYVEDIKLNLSSKLLVNVVQIFEDLMNTEFNSAVTTRKRLEKARSTCEDANAKVKAANKNKANLTKLLEAEKEFDAAKLDQERTCAQAMLDSQAALKSYETKSIDAYANYLGAYKEYFEKGLAYVTGLLQEVTEARRSHENTAAVSSASSVPGAAPAMRKPSQQQFAVNPGLAALKSPQSRESSAVGTAPSAALSVPAVPAAGRGSNPVPPINEQERFRSMTRDVVTSERSFLESLNLLQQLAGLARRDEKVHSKVPADELSSIFYKVDVLVQVHQEIIAALENQSNSADELSALFLNKLKGLQVHAEYSLHIAQSLDLLDANRKAFRSFEAFAKNAETKAGMDLHVLLLMPVHRTTVYCKLMAKVVQQNEGHQRAAEALARLTELVELVNTNHRISASVSTLMSLQKKLQRVEAQPVPSPSGGAANATVVTVAEEGVNVDIVSPDRRLLFEGSLSSLNKKDPDFYLFLFNDMVLVTKKQTLLKQMFSPDVMKQMINEKESVLYKVLAQLQLGQIEVEELPPTEAATGLRLHATGSPVFSMFAQTVAARDEWMARIKAAAEERTKSRVFGVALETLVARNGESGSLLPAVLEQCVAHLRETKAAQMEGLFRISGQSQEIEAIRNQYNKEGRARFNADTDVHCVTGVLKLWLRQLPDYLLTNALYDQWMNVCKLAESDAAAAIQAAKTTLTQLPSANRAAAHHLFAYLDEVRANSSVNKMTSANLATIFGPALVWKRSLSPYDMEAYKRAYSVVQLLLDKYSQIFGPEPSPVRKPLPSPRRTPEPAAPPPGPAPATLPKHAPPPVPNRPSREPPPDAPLPDPHSKSPRQNFQRRDSNVDVQASPTSASPLSAAVVQSLSGPVPNASPAPPMRPLPSAPAAPLPVAELPANPAPAPPPRPSPRIDEDFKRQAEEEFRRMEQLQYQQHQYAMPLAPLQPVTAQPVNPFAPSSRTSASGAPPQSSGIHVCKGCMGQIAGPFLQACGGEWHVEHFVCGRCHGSLQQGFFDTGTHPLCASCSATVPH